MGFLAQVKTWFLLHVILFYLFIVSGLIVCFLMLCAYILVRPFNKALYRKIVHILAYAHWCEFTFLAQWWSGSEMQVFAEDPDLMKYMGKEHIMAIINHKYDIDWLLSYVVSERIGMLGGTKIYGKSSLKWMPVLGWEWICTECIFLSRDWTKDKETLLRDLQYIADYPKNFWVTLVLFCEGTRFTESKHKASNEVARKKGRKELKHHLLPRTKGFVLSMHGLKGKVPAILDLTIGFRSDGAEPTLMNVIQGKKCKAEVYIRRIEIDSIPTDTDEACAEWLHKMYQEKDEIYDHFVQNGCYKMGTKIDIPRRPIDLIVTLSWMALTCIPLFKWLTSVFLSGSIALQFGIVGFLILVNVVVRKMIAVTEIKKSSSHGNVDANENKKEKSTD